MKYNVSINFRSCFSVAAALLLLCSCYKEISQEEEDIENKKPQTGQENDISIEDLEGDIISLDFEPEVEPLLLSPDMVVASYLAIGNHFKQALLISGVEWDDIPSAHSSYPNAANAIADNFYAFDNQEENYYTGWRVPTKEEANLLKKLYAGANISMMNDLFSTEYPLYIVDQKGNDVRYLCNEALNTFSFNPESTSNSQAGTQKRYHLRLVKTVILVY